MVASVDNLDSSVALEIASIDGSQELNNEALSALTLIVKTNIGDFDFDKVIVKKFDLALRKFIIKL